MLTRKILSNTSNRPLSRLSSLAAVLLISVLTACSGVEDALPAPGAEPTVAILGPAPQAAVTSDVVTMTCVVGEEVERVSYTVNGGEPVEVEFSSPQYSFPLQGLTDGRNEIELTVESATGLQSTSLLDIFWFPNTQTVARDDDAATELTRPARINVMGNDRGRDLELGTFTQPDNGTVTLDASNSNRLEYTADAGFTGSDTFTYTITGRDGRTDIGTVRINVLPHNPEAPTANDDTATTTQNTVVSIDVLANDTDPDNDPLQIFAASEPANGTVELLFDGFKNRTTSLSYTPDEGFTGTDTFTYSMSDSDGFNEGDGGDTATVTVR